MHVFLLTRIYSFLYVYIHTVVTNVLNCDMVVRKFEPQSCYYVHFRTNKFGRGMNLLSPHPQIWVK